LKLLGVTQGDEVIVPALTCAPTWMAVCRTGATPVPVDADAGTLMLDTAKVRVALSRKTKAIVPVNLFGHPADLQGLSRIAAGVNAALVEDNAQAHGARVGTQRTGSFGLVLPDKKPGSPWRWGSHHDPFHEVGGRGRAISKLRFGQTVLSCRDGCQFEAG
jgi:hypothetical protein